MRKLGGALVDKAHGKPEDVLLALQMQQDGDPRRLGEILTELGLVTRQQVEDMVREFKAQDQKEATIRVGFELLDKIINQVSELVLLRNPLLQLGAKQRDTDLRKTILSLNQLTTDLRKQTMKVRLQPVSNLTASGELARMATEMQSMVAQYRTANRNGGSRRTSEQGKGNGGTKQVLIPGRGRPKSLKKLEQTSRLCPFWKPGLRGECVARDP